MAGSFYSRFWPRSFGTAGGGRDGAALCHNSPHVSRGTRRHAQASQDAAAPAPLCAPFTPPGSMMTEGSHA